MAEFSYNYDNSPRVFVNGIYNGEKFNIDALIDSGADESISFKIIGELFFGLKFSGRPTEEITGIDRNVRGWRKPVQIEFCNETFSIDVIWIDKKHDPAKGNPTMILGRNTLFDIFDIEFRKNKTMIFRKS